MNSATPWKLLVDREVGKQLRRIPKRDRERIVAALEELVVNPYSGDIEKMKGEPDVWRRRAGAYRIFFEVLSKKRTVYVYHVARRTSTTY